MRKEGVICQLIESYGHPDRNKIFLARGMFADEASTEEDIDGLAEGDWVSLERATMREAWTVVEHKKKGGRYHE